MTGEYGCVLDAKGRITFPAKLRESLGETFMVTKGLDGCLFVYPMDEWSVLEDKIKNLPMSKSRNLQRFFFAGAVDVTPDKQGRVLIPANLRTYADLGKDIVVAGASVRAEIWDKEKWESLQSELDSDMIAQQMDEIDF